MRRHWTHRDEIFDLIQQIGGILWSKSLQTNWFSSLVQSILVEVIVIVAILKRSLFYFVAAVVLKFTRLDHSALILELQTLTKQITFLPVNRFSALD